MRILIVFSVIALGCSIHMVSAQQPIDSTTTNYRQEKTPRFQFGLTVGYGYRDWTTGPIVNESLLQRDYIGHFPFPPSDYAHGPIYFIGISGQYWLSEYNIFYLYSAIQIGLERIHESYNSNEHFSSSYFRPYPDYQYDIEFTTNRYLIQIPLLLKLNARFIKGFTLGVGPYVSFILSDHYTYKESFTDFNYQGDIVATSSWGFTDAKIEPLRQFTGGLQVEVGHEFGMGLGIKLFIIHALIDSYFIETGVLDSKLGLKLTYMFGARSRRRQEAHRDDRLR